MAIKHSLERDLDAALSAAVKELSVLVGKEKIYSFAIYTSSEDDCGFVDLA